MTQIVLPSETIHPFASSLPQSNLPSDTHYTDMKDGPKIYF